MGNLSKKQKNVLFFVVGSALAYWILRDGIDHFNKISKKIKEKKDSAKQDS